MARFVLLLFLFCLYSCSTSSTLIDDTQSSAHTSTTQNIESTTVIDSLYFLGKWSGDLKFDGYHLPMSIDWQQEAIYLSNPAQGTKNLKADTFYIAEDGFTALFNKQTFQFKEIDKNKMSMDFEDVTDTKHVVLYRDKPLAAQERPQTPQPTDDYLLDSITFVNAVEDVTLAGSLTMPNGKAPSTFAIMLTGSGPQDRDETIFHHKPFAVVADKLTRSGFGVLRYDDRGMGLSKGSQHNSTSFDFAQDAAAAYQFIESKYPDVKIGFIGHSEGGMIAQIADSLVHGAAFHIYLAGPGIGTVDLMVKQNEFYLKDIMSKEGVQTYITQLRPIFEMVGSSEELSKKQDAINKQAKLLYNSLDSIDAVKVAPSDMAYAMSMSSLIYNKWMTFFFSYEPQRYLSHITCPILALNGSEDFQVVPANLPAIKRDAVLADVTTIELEGLNHLFQNCKLCTLPEYNMLTETFSEEALETMVEWLTTKGF